MTIQAERMHRAKYVGRGVALPCPPWVPTLTASPCVHQPGSCPNTVLLGRLYHVSMIDH